MKRQILAIESTEQACSVALSVNGEVAQRLEMAPRKHSEKMLPLVEELLSAAKISLGEMDAIAFACGPGSFTGLRIATGVVQGLAYGAELPVVPVSSLAALAHSVFRQKSFQRPTCILAALDARMNEVYVAPYRVEALGVVTKLGVESVCSPYAVGTRYADLFTQQDDTHSPWFGAGSGWCYQEVFRELLPSVRAYQTDVTIEAIDVLYLAQTLFELGETISAENASPVYLRESVTWKKLPGRE